MYKVFLNERMIGISAPDKVPEGKPTIEFGEETSPDYIKKWFHQFLINQQAEVNLAHPFPEKFFLLFCSLFVNIPAAGGVVRANEKLLFILRNGKWDLPKGKIDKNETDEDAAVREVAEECGISGHTIIKQLPPTYHIYQSPYHSKKDNWVLKKTSWFEMKYNGSFPGTPETKEGITEIQWFTPNELEIVWANTYENLKQIIALYRA